MRSFLLSVFIFYQVSVEHAEKNVDASGCSWGWVEIHWENPEKMTVITLEGQRSSNKENEWDCSLSKNTDFGEYECSFNEKTLNLIIEPAVCRPNARSIKCAQPEDGDVYCCVDESSDDLYKASCEKIQVQDDLWKTLTIVFSVCGGAALLGFAAFFLYKRRHSSKSTEPDKEQPQNKEENQYEEIQDRPALPGSRTAIKTIYAVSTLPTEDSAGSSSTDASSITPSTTDALGITLSTTDTTSITPSTSDTISITPSGTDTTSTTPTPSASTIVYSSVISLPSENTERTQKNLDTAATDDEPATRVIYSVVKDQVKL